MYVGAAVFLSHWKAAQLRNSYPKNPGKNMVSHVSSNATTLNEPAKKFLFYNRVLEWIPELVKHTKVPITLLIFHHQWNRFVPHTYYSQTWLKKYSYLNWNASHQEWHCLIWKELKDFVFWNISQYILASSHPWMPRIFWIITQLPKNIDGYLQELMYLQVIVEASHQYLCKPKMGWFKNEFSKQWLKHVFQGSHF